jgi:hypothetical protein
MLEATLLMSLCKTPFFLTVNSIHTDSYIISGGTSTNLHHIWDTNMPEKYIGGYSISDAQTWANTITTAIDSGSYASQKSSWLTGISLTDPITSAMGWSADANAYVCSKVMPNGVSTLESTDLSGSYYTGNTATIQLLIAKGIVTSLQA